MAAMSSSGKCLADDMDGRGKLVVSRTRCGVQRCCAEPGPISRRLLSWHGPRLCIATSKRRCAASGARERRRYQPSPAGRETKL